MAREDHPEEDELDLGLKRWARFFMAKNSRDDLPTESGVSIMNSEPCEG